MFSAAHHSSGNVNAVLRGTPTKNTCMMMMTCVMGGSMEPHAFPIPLYPSKYTPPSHPTKPTVGFLFPIIKKMTVRGHRGEWVCEEVHTTTIEVSIGYTHHINHV